MLDVIKGDVLETLRLLDSDSVDAVLSDFPYGLSKEPDAAVMLRHWIAPELREHAIRVFRARGISEQGAAQLAADLYPAEDYQHGGAGFMGKAWDSFVPGPEVARELVRVLKPGGHALIFGGTRTYDLMVLALRLGGFQVRDQLAWMYGSGFPKSLDVSKAIDAAAGAVRDIPGQHAPAGGIMRFAPNAGVCATCGRHRGGQVGNCRCDKTGAPATPEAAEHAGEGTALKPAQEPIVLVRKEPDGTVAACVLEWGTGALQIDACRIAGAKAQRGERSTALGIMNDDGWKPKTTAAADDLGRWPANVILDPDAAAMLDEQTAGTRASKPAATGSSGGGLGYHGGAGSAKAATLREDAGASRFFYQAKASRRERDEHLAAAGVPVLSGGQATDRKDGSDGLKSPRAGAGRGGDRRNPHPTVKPLDLLRYLVRLISKPGDLVLVPYAGSGSEVIAAGLEGRDALGIEISEDYAAIAWARIGGWCERPELAERARAFFAAREEAAA